MLCLIQFFYGYKNLKKKKEWGLKQLTIKKPPEQDTHLKEQAQ